MPLEDKLKELAQLKKQKNELDWDKIKQDWLNAVTNLLDNISDWLKEYIEKGYVTCTYDNVVLTEDNLGSYSVQRLELDFSGKVIILEPLATIVFGAHGRVDMFRRDKRSRAIVLLLTDREKESWIFWRVKGHDEGVKLSKESFEHFIELMLGN